MKPRLFLIPILICLLLAPSPGISRAAEKEARLAHASWPSAIAATRVVQAVLQKKMGYTVSIDELRPEELWNQTASGAVDGFVCAWLPSLHAQALKEAEPDVVNLGVNCAGTRVGLVVPAYVRIDSIKELDAHANRFNGRIIGIDAGAGIMETTRQAIAAYNLENLELKEGSGAAMTETLKQRLQNRKWVVVTGWTPHWLFHRYDLKYLKDPKKIFGSSEYIKTIVRAGLEVEKPELYAFLDNFKWTAGDLQTVMDWSRQHGSPYEAALQWIRENPEKVAAWLPE
jgi:glycine betaine/proline transport system substrate-binding protein